MQNTKEKTKTKKTKKKLDKPLKLNMSFDEAMKRIISKKVKKKK